MKPVYEQPEITLYRGDCLGVMPYLIEQGVKIDAVICDPPYGTTACSWDVVIPFDAMWRNIKGLLKPSGACVLFGSEPFSSLLRVSNFEWFRYDWVWNKSIAGNPLIAKHQPLKIHEIISVFSQDPHHYYPEMRKGVMRKKGGGHSNLLNMNLTSSVSDNYFPTSILDFSNAERGFHPTQKPVALMRYLIRTYTNPGDTVLDFTCGSGTTLEAAKLEGRKCIGIERDTGKDGDSLGYIDYTIQRLAQSVMDLF